MARPSILDPYKPQVIQLVSKYHDISAVRVLEEIKKLEAAPGSKKS